MPYSTQLPKASGELSRAADEGWKVQDLNIQDLTLDIVFCDKKRPVYRGGPSDVYQGIYKEKVVALKLPRMLSSMPEQDIRRRFWREIQHWSKLEHPNIVRMLGVVHDGDSVYVASWWAENGTAKQYIKDNPNVQRYPIICGVMSGIAYLHDNNLVHGDIKAANILVSDSGQPMITDFGLSKVSAASTSFAMSGHGTIQWTAPELFNGETKTKASDVYAVALVIYEVLTMKPPFEWIGRFDSVIMQSVMNGARPPCTPRHSGMGEVFEPYWNIAKDGWAADPSHRPTIHTLLSRLRIITPSFVRPLPIALPPTASEPFIPVSSDTPPTIIHSGYMYLRGEEGSSWSSSSNIQLRYHFELLGSCLNYYQPTDTTHSNLIRSIQLSQCKLVNCINPTADGYEFSVVEPNGRPVYFTAETSKEAMHWMRCITKSMIHWERDNTGYLPYKLSSNIPSD